MSCHTMGGSGGKIGPDLTNESQKGRTKQWIIVQLTNPRSHNPKSPMPPFAMLDSTKLNDLADYLLSPHPKNIQYSNNQNAANPLSSENQDSNQQTNTTTSTNSNNESESGNNKHNATGSAADMIGNVVHGSLLFQRDCESCHGSNGNGGVPNPGSLSGQVPALNPINKNLYSKNPQTLIELFRMALYRKAQVLSLKWKLTAIPMLYPSRKLLILRLTF